MLINYVVTYFPYTTKTSHYSTLQVAISGRHVFLQILNRRFRFCKFRCLQIVGTRFLNMVKSQASGIDNHLTISKTSQNMFSEIYSHPTNFDIYLYTHK